MHAKQLGARTMPSTSIQSRMNVIGALILRDMRTRFGRSHIGYLLAIAWPFVHLTVLVTIMAFVNKVAPIGGDPAVFVSTGVLPYIVCLYPARMMGMALDVNRPLFLFPVVRPFDVIVSRAVIEFLTAFVVVILAYAALTLISVDVTPIDKVTLASGLLATIYLSLSFGFLNVVLASIFRMWNITFVMIMIILYMTAGVFAVPSALTADARELMWFNPLFHCVEWLRSAYYEGYGDDALSRTYLLSVATVSFFLGLLGERFLRGKLLAP
ncbi:ABC transporter permease [Ensifer sp. ZNC0028]|uniref:ABC transporter permease n=1 Tax=unclassified Ensifer TaxID=2633371 RepID=UPI0018CD9C29|nr:ABC transporter permease [Ensifer sp. ZNC0028]